MPRLTDKEKKEIKEKLKEDLSHGDITELAEEYNVSRTTIYNIRDKPNGGKYHKLLTSDEPLDDGPGFVANRDHTPLTTELFGDPPLEVRITKKDIDSLYDPGLSTAESKELFQYKEDLVKATGIPQEVWDNPKPIPTQRKLSKEDRLAIIQKFTKIVGCIHVNNHKTQRALLFEQLGSYAVKDVREYLIDLFFLLLEMIE